VHLRKDLLTPKTLWIVVNTTPILKCRRRGDELLTFAVGSRARCSHQEHDTKPDSDKQNGHYLHDGVSFINIEVYHELRLHIEASNDMPYAK